MTRRLAGVLAVLLAAASRLAAQEPGPSLAVSRDGPVARVQAHGLLEDGRFIDLMHSGFPLRLHFRLELWRDRSGWFDRFLTGVEWDAVARHDPLADEYVLISYGGTVKRFATSAELDSALDVPYRVTLESREGGRLYLVAHLDVTTLNDTDLEELTRWLKGDVTPAVSGQENFGQAIAHGAQRALVRIAGLPTLNLQGRSDDFTENAP
ncbi:MAG TPA: DUF4390 domain-containing protein [Gemmatimonadales bacterium]|nr:DUF4390 domain-containing protein [Gemmatimonadales bacterium]